MGEVSRAFEALSEEERKLYGHWTLREFYAFVLLLEDEELGKK